MSNTNEPQSVDDSPDHPIFTSKKTFQRDGIEYGFGEHTPLAEYPLEKTAETMKDVTELLAETHTPEPLEIGESSLKAWDYSRLTWGVYLVHCTDPSENGHLAEYEVTSGNHALSSVPTRTERSFKHALHPLIESANPHQYVNRSFVRIW